MKWTVASLAFTSIPKSECVYYNKTIIVCMSCWVLFKFKHNNFRCSLGFECVYARERVFGQHFAFLFDYIDFFVSSSRFGMNYVCISKSVCVVHFVGSIALKCTHRCLCVSLSVSFSFYFLAGSFSCWYYCSVVVWLFSTLIRMQLPYWCLNKMMKCFPFYFHQKKLIVCRICVCVFRRSLFRTHIHFYHTHTHAHAGFFLSFRAWLEEIMVALSSPKKTSTHFTLYEQNECVSVDLNVIIISPVIVTCTRLNYIFLIWPVTVGN